jgi:hypothetical protein
VARVLLGLYSKVRQRGRSSSCELGLLVLFILMRGIGILGSSLAGSCIRVEGIHPRTPGYGALPHPDLSQGA